MPEVLNIKNGHPENSIYIGRPSKFGNPFEIGKYGNRKRVIEMFRQYVLSNPELITQIKEELHGKDLVCFCNPKPCHGDILLKIANPELFEGLESFN